MAPDLLRGGLLCLSKAGSGRGRESTPWEINKQRGNTDEQRMLGAEVMPVFSGHARENHRVCFRSG